MAGFRQPLNVNDEEALVAHLDADHYIWPEEIAPILAHQDSHEEWDADMTFREDEDYHYHQSDGAIVWPNATQQLGDEEPL